jgi:isoquinoline 1-oxidoreductase beta subunit
MISLVGRDTRRYEIRAKATGTAVFGIDSRVPGMLFAVVARCPVFGGKLVSFDAAPKRRQCRACAMWCIRDKWARGFDDGGRGRACGEFVAAIEGRKALEVKWDLGPAARIERLATNNLWRMPRSREDCPQ